MKSVQRGSSRRWPGIVMVLAVAAGALAAWRFWTGGQGRPAPVVAASAAPERQPPALLIVQAPEGPSAWAPVPPALTPASSDAADEILEPRGLPAGNVSSGEPVAAESRPAASQRHNESDPPPDQAVAVADRKPALRKLDEAASGDATGSDEPPSENPAIDRARRLYESGKVIEARHELNALLSGRLSRSDQAEVRRLLAKIAAETIFSSRRLPDDPLVESYVVQPGDVLARIGQRYKVPPEILMQINGITDARRLRADQTIKVLKGPFHVRIYKSEFRMDVYLQDLYVRSFRVGLGADQGTPEGVWKVKERLHNPTYYPPAGSPIKRIVPPDAPENPLGKHWIGLEGVSGDAVGRVGYGIHGTNEPESIGKAVSLGCVRLLNEDVAFLYALLLPGESTVTILP